MPRKMELVSREAGTVARPVLEFLSAICHTRPPFVMLIEQKWCREAGRALSAAKRCTEGIRTRWLSEMWELENHEVGRVVGENVETVMRMRSRKEELQSAVSR